MKDNWSLKGKIRLTWFGTPLYSQETIETLRQKIIEDINNHLKEIGIGYSAGSDCQKACKEIMIAEIRKLREKINRRFGFSGGENERK
ncbi:hypothetical protein B6U81_01740 [Thermoplasmatales archaeon ex4484_30]|nr:MAG: hypothetical protein B6U81_01740 [Thermoplasmatales archaeon ex4484_30]